MYIFEKKNWKKMGIMNIQIGLFCGDDIENYRPTKENANTIQGTRKLQCVKTMVPYLVKTLLQWMQPRYRVLKLVICGPMECNTN